MCNLTENELLYKYCSRVLIIYSRALIFSNTSHQKLPVCLHMHSLQTNYNFTITVIHYDYLKTLSKIIPLNQHKFTFEIRVKKLDANLVYMNMKIREYENTHMNNRANLYYHVLIQVNMMPILNVTKSLR